MAIIKMLTLTIFEREFQIGFLSTFFIHVFARRATGGIINVSVFSAGLFGQDI